MSRVSPYSGRLAMPRRVPCVESAKRLANKRGAGGKEAASLTKSARDATANLIVLSNFFSHEFISSPQSRLKRVILQRCVGVEAAVILAPESLVLL